MKRALLVEDHALFREGLALLLRWRMGLESVEAESLDEGRQILSDLTGMVDLAIISVDLSDGDGCELIEQLHESKPDIPILALTADRSLNRRAQSLEAGADDVLTKKAPVEQIIDAAKRLVGG